jgi:hypothetical protein
MNNKLYSKILLFIQKYFPLYVIYIILLIKQKIYLNYLLSIQFNYIRLDDLIYLINYKNNQSDKYIVIINGGGFIADDCTDIILSKLLLPKLPKYNIITLKYSLCKNYSEIYQEVISSLTKLNEMKYNLEVFIGNSIGGSLLLDYMSHFGSLYKNKKKILISPCVNFDIKENKNIHEDCIDFNLCKTLFCKYADKQINIDYSLSNTLVIVSDKEFFYYDIINFYNKLNNNNKLLVLKDCTHSDIIHYGFSNSKKDSIIYTVNYIISSILIYN